MILLSHRTRKKSFEKAIQMFREASMAAVPTFLTTNLPFPETNHTQFVDEHNLGWTRGIMTPISDMDQIQDSDLAQRDTETKSQVGIPFEAEWWKEDGYEGISVFVPIQDYEPSEKQYYVVSSPDLDSEIAYLNYNIESTDYSVLAIGMVIEGEEPELNIIQSYVKLLTGNTIIEFTGSMENGAVQYLTDVNGNTFARIMITLEDDAGRYGECYLKFEDFPANKNRNRFRLV